MIEIMLSVMLLVSAGFNFWFGYKLMKLGNRFKDMSRNYGNYQEMEYILRDLNRWSGSMIEIRRVNPDSVFVRSPQ